MSSIISLCALSSTSTVLGAHDLFIGLRQIMFQCFVELNLWNDDQASVAVVAQIYLGRPAGGAAKCLRLPRSAVCDGCFGSEVCCN